MIVLDENLSKRPLAAAIARWYKGAVVNIKDLRPGSVIKDDAVPMLLRTVSQPTFVTTNYDDYWRVMPASPDYCLICFKLPQERKAEVPALLREVLRRAQYATKRSRMGRVISVRGRAVADYAVTTRPS